MTTNNSQNEIDLLALQYIGDELSEDARAAFEARLMDNQAAREAVAAAVEVTLAARAAFEEDAVLLAVRQELRQPVSYRGWLNVVIACGVLFALIAASQFLRPARQPASSDAGLAIAWSEARREWPASALADAELEETEFVVVEDDVTLPTWMLAAVSEAKTMGSEMNEGDEIPE
jgi:predicted NodU family carbamoyl transferase